MFSVSRKVSFLSRTSQNIISGSILAQKKNIHETKHFDQKHGLISLEKYNLETKENLYFIVQQSFFFI